MFDIPKWFKNANVDLPCGVIKQLAMEVSGEIIDCAASAMCSAALRKKIQVEAMGLPWKIAMKIATCKQNLLVLNAGNFRE